MHSRSIEFAKKFGVPIVVRSSFEDGPGTEISSGSTSRRIVSGVALAKNEARITVEDVPDQPGASHQLFSELALRGIAVDMIIQNAGTNGTADISFTVTDQDLPSALKTTECVAERIQAVRVTNNPDVAKVSIVGMGMTDAEGVAATLFDALSVAKINVHMITTSEIKVSVLVDRQDAQKSVEAAIKLLDSTGWWTRVFPPSPYQQKNRSPRSCEAVGRHGRSCDRGLPARHVSGACYISELTRYAWGRS